MDVKSEAEELMEKFRLCAPKKFFSSVEETERGTGFILAFLDREKGEVIAGDIAREMNVTTARVAALLRNMEKNGLILRENSSEDARCTVVRITGKGTDFISRKKAALLKKTELLIEKVGRKDLEEFIRISHKIREVMEENN